MNVNISDDSAKLMTVRKAGQCIINNGNQSSNNDSDNNNSDILEVSTIMTPALMKQVPNMWLTGKSPKVHRIIN